MADRERSPNYPALDLETAAALVKRLYDKEGRSVMSNESLAQALGSSSDTLSGPYRSKIAALRHYGLTEKVGVGKAKLSALGVSLGLRSVDDPDYWQAIRSAALFPALFKALWDRYQDGGSSANIRNYLVEDLGFAKLGAERAAKAFMETRAFAKLDSTSYNLETEQVNGTEETSTAAPVVAPGPTRATTNTGSGKVEVNKMYAWIADGIDVKMTFDRHPTAKAIARIQSYLSTMEEDLRDTEARVTEAAASDDSVLQ